MTTLSPTRLRTALVAVAALTMLAGCDDDGSATGYGADFGDEPVTLLEAIGTSHNGRADGDEPVRILAVNIGSDTAANTVADDG